MNARRLFALAAVATCSLQFGTARAQTADSSAACKLRVETPALNWTIRGYNPFAADPAQQDFTLTFSNDGDGPCAFRPVFNLDAESFGLTKDGAQHVPYNLLDLFGNYDAAPRSGATPTDSAHRMVIIEAHGQQSVGYRLSVPNITATTDGIYGQSVRVSAETADGAELANRQLTLALEITPSVFIGLSGAFHRDEGRATVQLGELAQGISPIPLNLFVQSTRSFTIDVASQNGGLLRLAGTDWSVGYQLLLGDQTLNLTTGGQYSSPVGTDLAKDTIPLRFAIGNPAGKRAGTYSDVITLTVAVN